MMAIYCPVCGCDGGRTHTFNVGKRDEAAYYECSDCNRRCSIEVWLPISKLPSYLKFKHLVKDAIDGKKY